MVRPGRFSHGAGGTARLPREPPRQPSGYLTVSLRWRAGDALVRLIRRRRARDEPVAWPSGWSRHLYGRHLDADAGRAVATWAGRDICACRRSTRQRHGTCHDQTCERFTPWPDDTTIKYTERGNPEIKITSQIGGPNSVIEFHVQAPGDLYVNAPQGAPGAVFCGVPPPPF